MWNPFRRGGKPAPQAPAPAPGQAPAPAGPSEPAPPKRGRLGRLFGRKPKPAPKEPEKPKTPTRPTQPPQTPQTSGGEEAGGQAGEPQRTYPGSLSVSATGTWKISKSLWHGTASGTLTGAAVKIFLDAMEDGDTDIAVFLIAQAYDDGSGFADMLDTSGTTVDISY